MTITVFRLILIAFSLIAMFLFIVVDLGALVFIFILIGFVI